MTTLIYLGIVLLAIGVGFVLGWVMASPDIIEHYNSRLARQEQRLQAQQTILERSLRANSALGHTINRQGRRLAAARRKIRAQHEALHRRTQPDPRRSRTGMQL